MVPSLLFPVHGFSLLTPAIVCINIKLWPPALVDC